MRWPFKKKPREEYPVYAGPMLTYEQLQSVSSAVQDLLGVMRSTKIGISDVELKTLKGIYDRASQAAFRASQDRILQNLRAVREAAQEIEGAAKTYRCKHDTP